MKIDQVLYWGIKKNCIVTQDDYKMDDFSKKKFLSTFWQSYQHVKETDTSKWRKESSIHLTPSNFFHSHEYGKNKS